MIPTFKCRGLVERVITAYIALHEHCPSGAQTHDRPITSQELYHGTTATIAGFDDILYV
jgi:hypothetical protein